MELTLTRRSPKVSRIFDYVATRFDNGIKYGVWNGGKAPLNGLRIGTYVGQVARFNEGDSAEEWFAASNIGTLQDADKILWYGPFPNRKEASVFLLAFAEGFHTNLKGFDVK